MIPKDFPDTATKPTERFHCRPFRVVLTGASCVMRQRARKPSGGQLYTNCAMCSVGLEHRTAFGESIPVSGTPAPPHELPAPRRSLPVVRTSSNTQLQAQNPPTASVPATPKPTKPPRRAKATKPPPGPMADVISIRRSEPPAESVAVARVKSPPGQVVEVTTPVLTDISVQMTLTSESLTPTPPTQESVVALVSPLGPKAAIRLLAEAIVQLSAPAPGARP